jgi:hypothetical protein
MLHFQLHSTWHGAVRGECRRALCLRNWPSVLTASWYTDWISSVQCSSGLGAVYGHLYVRLFLLYNLLYKKNTTLDFHLAVPDCGLIRSWGHCTYQTWGKKKIAVCWKCVVGKAVGKNYLSWVICYKHLVDSEIVMKCAFWHYRCFVLCWILTVSYVI